MIIEYIPVGLKEENPAIVDSQYEITVTANKTSKAIGMQEFYNKWKREHSRKQDRKQAWAKSIHMYNQNSSFA